MPTKNCATPMHEPTRPWHAADLVWCDLYRAFDMLQEAIERGDTWPSIAEGATALATKAVAFEAAARQAEIDGVSLALALEEPSAG